jgi:hypothetical protein
MEIEVRQRQEERRKILYRMVRRLFEINMYSLTSYEHLSFVMIAPRIAQTH